MNSEVASRIRYAGCDRSIFPYIFYEDAVAGLVGASDHFEEEFHVRRIREGYIQMSRNYILDARGLVLPRRDPLLEEDTPAWSYVMDESERVQKDSQ